MLQLVYASSESCSFSPADLVALLEKSRANNTKLGVTGMLLHQHGSFLQVLEGEAQTVRALYARIAQDPRHAHVALLHEASSAQREFPDWSMGFRDLDSTDPREHEGFSRLLQSGISASSFAVDPPRAKALLLMFKDRGDLILVGRESQAAHAAA